MAIITELSLVDKAVRGGEKIQVHVFSTLNKHIHQLTELLCRLEMSMLEMDMNNSVSGNVLTDAEAITLDWARFKKEWDRAVKYRDLAPAALETEVKVLKITRNEMLRIPNVRIRRVVEAIDTLIEKLLFSDSAKMQYAFTDLFIKKVAAHMGYVEEILTEYIGDGVKSRGIDIAAHESLGELVPPLNMHESISSETSPAGPVVPQADAPDLASTIPAPGSDTARP